MLQLNGLLDIDLLGEIKEYTEKRFIRSESYNEPEALSLYEQKIFPEEKIKSLCEESSGVELHTPVIGYIPSDILNLFKGERAIPLSFSPMRNKIVCGTLVEFNEEEPCIAGYEVEMVNVPIYYYFREYVKLWGRHNDLLDIPAKNLFDIIIQEGISLGAADVTISSKGNNAEVYYNVRKKKVHSNRIIGAGDMADVIELICIENPMDNMTNNPKYVGIDLTNEFRGRIVINPKFKGHTITIRYLPNKLFDKRLEDCNITPETIKFFREQFMSRDVGLRLIVGSTMSGKNTTALAILNEIVEQRDPKTVSVEMPVEQELNGVEQINCLDEEEFDKNVSSLLRQNPDVVYITEIGDFNANSIIRVANTGKWLMSTLHANSCIDVFSRLEDITELGIDRLIQVIHSIVYQELVRDEEKDIIYPRDRYIYLSPERKLALYNQDYAGKMRLLSEWEAGDVW